jgi:cell division protein FtsB
MLLLGGALAVYLGFDELKDTWKDDETVESPPESSEGEGEGEGEEVEKYKKEIDDLKEEIETLKKD